MEQRLGYNSLKSKLALIPIDVAITSSIYLLECSNIKP